VSVGKIIVKVVYEMKTVNVLITTWCPHCKRAISWIEELKNENPKFAQIEVKIIDEELHPEISKQYDYYYVPTYYVDGTKIYEGGTTKEIVRLVFEKACE